MKLLVGDTIERDDCDISKETHSRVKVETKANVGKGGHCPSYHSIQSLCSSVPGQLGVPILNSFPGTDGCVQIYTFV